MHRDCVCSKEFVVSWVGDLLVTSDLANLGVLLLGGYDPEPCYDRVTVLVPGLLHGVLCESPILSVFF